MSNLYSSRLRRIVVVIVFLIAVASLSLLSDAFTANAQTNWTLQWSDEFNGASGTGVNTSNWLYDSGTGYGCPGCPGQWGTGEVESVTNSTANVFQDGAGHLNIKPIRDGSGNWTSGRIETQRTDFQPPIGGLMRVEASLQQPNVTGSAAAGYWPAFWMLGAPFRGNYLNWPGIGEWDVMEDINGLSSVFGTLHCGVDPGGPCNETTGKGSGQHACSGCQTGFHTYAIEYDQSVSPEQLRWYLDGVNYFTLNSSQIDATTWNNATHRGNFIILNVAMGGAFPAAFGGGPTGSTQSGVPMLVDYVRVYYANGSGNPPTNTPIPTNTQSGPPTNTPIPSATPTTGTSGGNNLYVLSGGTLSQTAGAGASADTISSAGGANYDSTPHNPLTYTISGLNGSYNSGATQFNLFVDSGANIANGVQARVSYDFTGSGTWSRIETYHYYPTDDVVGYENYNQTSFGGLESSSGSFSNMSNGKVKVEVWSAIGTASSTLRTNATSGNGQQSVVTVPFNLGGSSPTNTPTATATNRPTNTPTNTPTPSAAPHSNVVYVLSGGALSWNAGAGASADTISSAGGGNYDGTVHNPLTYTINGVSGTYNSGATQFNLFVDSGMNIANGVQVRVSYDFTGSGTWGRVETYHYYPTNDVVGYENYNQTSFGGLESSSGSFSNMSNGKIKIEVWSAIGTASSTLRTNATSGNGQQSIVTLPFNNVSG
ncbi:MAG TPA: glycoside hydrolase family 16 protein [Aggregatilineales bacterium]|nr:glycoside hydrolase family 16 protein [Aggregatilineales bacterium]